MNFLQRRPLRASFFFRKTHLRCPNSKGARQSKILSLVEGLPVRLGTPTFFRKRDGSQRRRKYASLRNSPEKLTPVPRTASAVFSGRSFRGLTNKIMLRMETSGGFCETSTRFFDEHFVSEKVLMFFEFICALLPKSQLFLGRHFFKQPAYFCLGLVLHFNATEFF